MESDLQANLENWLGEKLRKLGYKEYMFEIGNGLTGGHIADGCFFKVVEKGDSSKTLNLLLKKGKVTGGDFNDSLVKCCENEAVFYSKLLPRLLEFNDSKKASKFEYIPKCYLAIRTEKEQVVIMEDLNASNFKMNNPKHALDLNHLEKIMEAYGEWHALGMAFNDHHPKEFNDLAKLFSSIENTNMIIEIQLAVKKMHGQVAEMYEKRGQNDMAEKVRKLGNDFRGARQILINPENSRSVTFKHGDNWNNNYLFHYPINGTVPDKVKIVDWQVVGASSPLLDVVSCLYTCSSKEELNQLDDLLKIYHRKFSEKMRELDSDPDKLFSYEYLVEQWKNFAIFGLSQTIGFFQFRGKKEISYIAFDDKGANDKGESFFTLSVDEDVYFPEVDGVFSHAVSRGFM